MKLVGGRILECFDRWTMRHTENGFMLQIALWCPMEERIEQIFRAILCYLAESFPVEHLYLCFSLLVCYFLSLYYIISITVIRISIVLSIINCGLTMYFSKNFFLSNIEKYYISVGTVYFIINKMLSLIIMFQFNNGASVSAVLHSNHLGGS